MLVFELFVPRCRLQKRRPLLETLTVSATRLIECVKCTLFEQCLRNQPFRL